MLEILPQLLINALITGSIYALAAAGLAISYGTLRILNFAHGHLMMLGAYFFFLYSIEIGLGVLPSALLTGTSSIAVGWLSLVVFVEPFSRYSALLPFVTTLALSTILESIVAITFGVNVKSLSQGGSIESFEFYGMFITPIQILIIVSAIGLLTLLALAIHCTPFGRKLRSLSEFPAGAQALGINQRGCVRFVFVVATLFAVYAGIMVGFETNLQPTMGNSFTMKSFAAMTLGGLGNVWGAVIASYILGLIENLSLGIEIGGYSLPAGYKDAFAFIVILLVLLVRPRGLFGRAARRA